MQIFLIHGMLLVLAPFVALLYLADQDPVLASLVGICWFICWVVDLKMGIGFSWLTLIVKIIVVLLAIGHFGEQNPNIFVGS
jgi:hypothetical protein